MGNSAAGTLCYLGHAGFALSTETACLLMDPWLSGNGAFIHTWFPYPDNTDLADQIIDFIGSRRLYIFVSHVHEDHLDLDFIKRTEPFNPVYLFPQFIDNSLRRRVASLAGEKYYLRDRERIKIENNFSAQLFLEESGINTDSAILVRCKSHIFLNLNDCKLYDRLPTLGLPAIDVFTCQFSGATWHPLCYDYDLDTYRAISSKRKNAKFFQVERAIRAIDPKVFVPSAGPAVFLHPSLYERNFEAINIFPKAEEFISYLERRKLTAALRILRPGEGLELGSTTLQDILHNESSTDLESYKRSKQHLFAPRAEHDPDELLALLLREVRKKLQQFETRLTTQFTILFGVAGATRQIQIKLNIREAMIVGQQSEAGPLYVVVAASEAVYALVSRTLEWENFCLSFLFKIHREPDEYCPLVNMFFFCSPANVRTALLWLETSRSNDARIEIDTEVGSYTCRRFCPHQGADLTYGYAEGSFWVCPRHRWRFNLTDVGRSEDGSCSIDAKLNVREGPGDSA